MAYVGSFSYTGEAKGITCFDVDMEAGHLIYKEEVEVDNSSYLICHGSLPVLYSLCDEGIVSFHIASDGSLKRINQKKINGLRGSHMSISRDNRFICISGYHDGKGTVMSINEDGSVGNIKYQFYNKGYGSIAERNFMPHVTCTRFTADMKYILSVDAGIDQVKIFEPDAEFGKLRLADIIRCELGSSPRFFRFSSDGKYMYLIYEIANMIDVYKYEEHEDGVPGFEKIQTIRTSVKADPKASLTAAYAMRLTPGENKYVLVSNAGENTVTVYSREAETGMLTMERSLPISGQFPKDISIFPDGKHIAVANHQSNEISLFTIDYEKGLLIMCARNIKINQPNSIRFVKLPE